MKERIGHRWRRAASCALLLWIALVLALAAGRIAGERAPPNGAPPSGAWTQPSECALGRELAQQAGLGPEESAWLALSGGAEALSARLDLIDRAERAIDFQYYMLVPDEAGERVVARLLAAADRGVRVRMLLDDFGSARLDAWMPELDLHPRIEVRYFNAFARGPLGALHRVSDGAWRWRTLEHRMHNKLLAVDGAAAVVGGRNVGNEYFDLDPELNFVDADLLVGGAVLEQLGRDFDAYWNSTHAACVGDWPRLRREAADLERLRQRLRRAAAGAGPRTPSPLADVSRGVRAWTLAPMRAVADSPRKVEAAAQVGHLLETLWDDVAIPQRELLIVSPYFVPGEYGTRRLLELAAAGVRVVVLTNSLAATDVAVVHAGYAAYRRELLAGGVEIFELKPVGLDAHFHPLGGSSGASLHAKGICQDRQNVFVGSLNLDPRSVLLNTEQGVLVRSSALAAEFVARFERGTSPQLSWRVRLDERGGLRWDSQVDGQSATRDVEPDAGWARRLTARVTGWLPIERML